MIVYVVFRHKITIVPYMRSYMPWCYQTSSVTGSTIKIVIGYATNHTKGCEWSRWDLTLLYNRSNICRPLDWVRLQNSWSCLNESIWDIDLICFSKSTRESRNPKIELYKGDTFHASCSIKIYRTKGLDDMETSITDKVVSNHWHSRHLGSSNVLLDIIHYLWHWNKILGHCQRYENL